MEDFFYVASPSIALVVVGALMMVYVTQEPGAKLPVRVRRDDEELSLALKVHRNPEYAFNTPDFSSPIEARVGSVGLGTAADEGGVLVGDRLLSVDGKPVTGWGEFQRLIQRRPDQDVTLRVARGEGQELTDLDLTVRPQARDADGLPPHSMGWEPHNLPVIGFVEPGSPADQAGLKIGDRLIRVIGVNRSKTKMPRLGNA